MKFLSLISGNLRRKKLRTLLTVMSIFVALLLFGLLCAVKEAFSMGVTMAQADRLIVRHKISFIMPLPENYGARISQIEGVEALAHWNWFGGIYRDDPKNFFGTFPVEPEDFLKVNNEFALSQEQRQAWLRTRTGAIIGPGLAKRFGWKIGDRVPIKSPIWPIKGEGAWEFDIVGVYEPSTRIADPTSLFFRYDYFDEARARGKGEVGWYVVRVKDPSRAEAVAAAIDQQFANSPAETKSQPEGAFAQEMASQVGDIGTILVAILTAVFFTILLVVGNTMAQSVRERAEELGVLKAMGFSNELILVLVLVESCTIAALGGLSGLAAGWFITQAIGNVPAIAQYFPVFYVPERDVALGLGIVLGLGFAAGIFPALQAMRLQTALALRRHL